MATSGLFLCTVAYNYVSLAKRFMPEPLNFLNGLLFLARATDTDVDFGQVTPPCRPVGKHNCLLRLVAREIKDAEETASTSSSLLNLASIPIDASKKKKNLAADECA